MNRKFLMAQLNQELVAKGQHAQANWAAKQMEAAFDSINALNTQYNNLLGGKWDGMMAVPSGFCALYHNKPDVTYTQGAGESPVCLLPTPEPLDKCHLVNLSDYESKSQDARLVKGLGYDWQVMQLGQATYSFPEVTSDTIEVTLYTLPFWPLYTGRSNAVSISVDGGAPQTFENTFVEYSRSWKDQVMRNGAVCRLQFAIDKTKKQHTISLAAKDSYQMVQRVIIDWGGLKPSYVGPSSLYNQ